MEKKTIVKNEIVKNGIHGYSAAETYIAPKEPAVKEHLEWFMGLKLGLMMHWAPRTNHTHEKAGIKTESVPGRIL